MTTYEQIRQLQERIESLEKQVKNLEDENENLADQLTDAEDTIDELEARIDELEEEDLGPEVKETACKFRLREALEKEEAKSVKEREAEWEAERERMAQSVCDVRVDRKIADGQYSDLLYKGFSLPETLEEIGRSVFNNCPNINTIEIPSSVKTIGRAFCKNCTNLNTVTFLCPCPEKLLAAFVGCPNLLRINVPEGEVERYKAAMPGLADKILTI